MPKLIDIVGKMSVNNVLSTNIDKSMYRLRAKLPQEELTVKNKLKTILQTNNGKPFSAESSGEFAGWRNELNKKPKYDFFESQPLNKIKVKNDKTNEMQIFKKMIKYNEWLRSVDERLKMLGLNI